MDMEKVIKEYEDYVNSYISLTTSHDYEFEMHKAVLALLKEQQNQIWEMQDRTEYLEDKLNKQPQIVRCKDCKYSLSNSRFCAYPHNKNNIQPCDWFCADGEKRE